MRKIFIILLIISCFSFRLNAQGLRFNGSEVTIDERTSLSINFSPLKLNKSCKEDFRLSFDLFIYQETKSGYVFELDMNDSKDEQMLVFFYDGLKENHNFAIIWKYHRFVINAFIPKSEMKSSDKWMNIGLSVNPISNKITLVIDNSYTFEGELEIPKDFKPSLQFGRTINTIDIPSFALRTLEIDIDKAKYNFDFLEDSGNLCDSRKGLAYGKVTNPIWLANEFTRWKKVYERSSDSFQSVGYNKDNHEIYVFDNEDIEFYDISSNSIRSESFKNSIPLPNILGMSFVDNTSNKIYAYELYYFNNLAGSPSVSSLDLSNMTWEVESHQTLSYPMHHHNQYFNPADSSFYIFGGFGNRILNGSFYKYKDGVWTDLGETNGDYIWPRYFAGMGYNHTNDKLLIFGGQGNESGDQIVGRQYLYDLHEVSLNSLSSKKLWDGDWKGRNNVVARNIIVSEDGKSFYALCYPESITESKMLLYKYSIKDGEHHSLADSINIYSDKLTCNANLYYDKEIEKLIATVEESKDDIESRVSVYTISYPPKNILVSTVRKRSNARILFSFVFAGFVFAVVVFSLHRVRRKKKYDIVKYIDTEFEKNKANSIKLFGEFTVIDRDGNDISSQFTEKLKQILIILLQNGAKGISSKALSSIIWPYKEEEKAKNIRGVSISNLRKLLKQLDGISLNFEDGLFQIVTSEPFYCDYLTLNSKDTDEIIRFSSRGQFLLGETDPIYDSIKEDVDRELEHIMLSELSIRFNNKEFRNVLTCASILFRIDPYNEYALEYSIKAYNVLRMQKEAKAKYQEFITRYKKDYGEAYTRSYEDLL